MRPKFDKYFSKKSIKPSFWKLIYNMHPKLPDVATKYNHIAQLIENTNTHELRIVVCGDGGTGKSVI